MSVTSGFFDHREMDRLYTATQMGRIFDGIIQDGVYSTYGTCFQVTAYSGMTVNVGIGRAWFDHTWTLNDSLQPMTADESELLLDRIDALVLDINNTVDVRENSIMWVKGTPSNSPQKPTMISEDEHHQYPLAYITIKANITTINQADIEYVVGTSECPFVTGVLQQVTIDVLLAQWAAQFQDFMDNFASTADSWYEEEKNIISAYVIELENQFAEFYAAAGREFTDWFGTLQDILDEDTAGHLQNEIDNNAALEFNHYYGLFNQTTVINDSTEVVEVSTAEASMRTTFSSSKTTDVITTTITPVEGNFYYIRTTTIQTTSTGSTITTTYSRRGKTA